HMVLDIAGPSIANLCEIIDRNRMLLWNGPMGAFEFPPFDIGTNMLARHVGARSRMGALYSVGGGGDTLAALKNSGADQDFSYISTAGGAFLEFLEGRNLPGLEALGLSITKS
ncbi:MAG: phosphoglycerate kinase, partial [Pseudomonadota bacterium]